MCVPPVYLPGASGSQKEGTGCTGTGVIDGSEHSPGNKPQVFCKSNFTAVPKTLKALFTHP